MKTKTLIWVAASIVSLALSPGLARAAVIEVDTTRQCGDPNGDGVSNVGVPANCCTLDPAVGDGDTVCSLGEAICAAVLNMNFGDCYGNGDYELTDVIEIDTSTAGETFEFKFMDNFPPDGPNALPIVQAPQFVIINGNGSTWLRVSSEGNNGPLDPFRAVKNQSSLTVNDVTFSSFCPGCSGYCGDGFVEPDVTYLDPGAPSNGNGTRVNNSDTLDGMVVAMDIAVLEAYARSTPNNAILVDLEECEDGNNNDGDGCDAHCNFEKPLTCGNGAVDVEEECDPNALPCAIGVKCDQCTDSCKLIVCGNGRIDSGEQCDDGNIADGDGCDADCRLETCGDGVVDTTIPGNCDDGGYCNISRASAYRDRCISDYACIKGLCAMPMAPGSTQKKCGGGTGEKDCTNDEECLPNAIAEVTYTCDTSTFTCTNGPKKDATCTNNFECSPKCDSDICDSGDRADEACTDDIQCANFSFPSNLGCIPQGGDGCNAACRLESYGECFDGGAILNGHEITRGERPHGECASHKVPGTCQKSSPVPSEEELTCDRGPFAGQDKACKDDDDCTIELNGPDSGIQCFEPSDCVYTSNGTTYPLENNTCVYRDAYPLPPDETVQAGFLNLTGDIFILNQTEIEKLNGRAIPGVGGAIASGFAMLEMLPVEHSMDITGTLFSLNKSILGGAIAATVNEINIQDSTFLKNAAIQMTDYMSLDIPGLDSKDGWDPTGTGGAIVALLSDIRLNRVSFEENSAQTLGGAIATLCNELSVTDSTIFSNKADQMGGGIFSLYDPAVCFYGLFLASPEIRDAISSEFDITANPLLLPAGVDQLLTVADRLFSSTATLKNSTVFLNLTPDGEGAGIYSLINATDLRSRSRRFFLEETILNLNMGSNKTLSDCQGSLDSLGHNVIGTTKSCIVASNTGDHFDISPANAIVEECGSSSVPGRQACPLKCSLDNVALNGAGPDASNEDQLQVDRYLNGFADIGAVEASCQICGNGITEYPKESCDTGGICSLSSVPCTSNAYCLGDIPGTCAENDADGNAVSCLYGTDCTLSGAGAVCNDATLDVCTPIGGDGCSATCALETCGDGVTQFNEECDNGGICSDNGNPCNNLPGPTPECNAGATCIPQSNDGCNAACNEEKCGDGVRQTSEDCDDGNTIDNDGCDNDCHGPVCGNGVIEGREECEFADGVTLPADCYCHPTSCELECMGGGGGSSGVCGDEIIQGGEECDDGAANNANTADKCRTNCRLPHCMDGIQDKNETCDDGDSNPFNGCTNFCTPPNCGDGILQTGEACDPPNGVTCTSGCLAVPPDTHFCGDGNPDPGEECDKGLNNSNSQDALCRPDCTNARCGDGIKDPTRETCDDGNQTSGDGCSDICVAEYCGDTVYQPRGEECDPSVTGYSPPPGYMCTPQCNLLLIPMTGSCNDGTVQSALGEECELAVSDSVPPGYQCTPYCQLVPILTTCGNGIVQNGEQCDDGNTNSLDGCSGLCQREKCGDGIIQVALGEQCDNGGECAGTFVYCNAWTPCSPSAACNPIATEYCSATCKNITPPKCGDGILDAGDGEECDDGNLVPGDTCSPTCKDETCGDGIVTAMRGEECDDENVDNDDACTNDCKINPCGGIIDPVIKAACEDAGGAPGWWIIYITGLLEAGLEVDANICINVAPSVGGDLNAPVIQCCQNCLNGDGNAGECLNACPNGSNTGGGPGGSLCGNNAPDPNEECDQGAANSNAPDAACRIGCILPRCGDGIKDPESDRQESCDDGNQSSGDGCSETCQLEGSCGDGIVNGIEQCDDGDRDAFDDCKNDCTTNICGDGVINLTPNTPSKEAKSESVSVKVVVKNPPKEACDDGNNVNNDTCDDQCRETYCGDEIVQMANGENCEEIKDDDGEVIKVIDAEGEEIEGLSDTLKCISCTITCCGCDDDNNPQPYCGDGISGNTAGEECDDGNATNTDACTNGCKDAICGDSIVGPDEDCDDGNTDNTDACLSTCKAASCGDGFIEAGVETCELPNTATCDAVCQKIPPPPVKTPETPITPTVPEGNEDPCDQIRDDLDAIKNAPSDKVAVQLLAALLKKYNINQDGKIDGIAYLPGFEECQVLFGSGGIGDANSVITRPGFRTVSEGIGGDKMGGCSLQGTRGDATFSLFVLLAIPGLLLGLLRARRVPVTIRRRPRY